MDMVCRNPSSRMCLSMLTVVSAMFLLSRQAAAQDESGYKGGAQYFVGEWQCAGKVIVPVTKLSVKTTAHLKADAEGKTVVDHFSSKGVLGLGASAKGVTDWDEDTRTLTRRATSGWESVEWVNHGGWKKDTLQLEAKMTTWFHFHDVWLLDEFVRADANHFAHHTYFARDAQHWEPFYLATCEKIAD